MHEGGRARKEARVRKGELIKARGKELQNLPTKVSPTIAVLTVNEANFSLHVSLGPTCLICFCKLFSQVLCHLGPGLLVVQLSI